MNRPTPPLQEHSAGNAAAYDGRLHAILGPTNTGKTHIAVERMLSWPTGMMGLPLRLLAREIYDRVRRQAGGTAVALLTGEEKILPASPRYFICTTEAMPVARPVDFVCVDEIQLAADRERGHIFTDRLLRARGNGETLFLGSETARRLIRQLLPRIEIETRSRFSKLGYLGPRKISRLPPRSAVVSFSSEHVYAVAELIRRQRGGAAVVTGGLSPRTRNAQVALYQNGDVDFMAATDAIGMGLNMDVDHVAFAQGKKFDGRQFRALKATELAQIAGRAGRYRHDGSFGTTGETPAFDETTIKNIEHHRFNDDPFFYWRNHRPDFSSLAALMTTLDQAPARPGLVRYETARDIQTLNELAHSPGIMARAVNPAGVERLWEVAQVPDFRKTLNTAHAALLAPVYLFRMSGNGYIPEDWFNAQIVPCNRTDGNIDTLSARIAHMRTWTFLANRPGWLRDPRYWQEQTRALEDRLSDALHAKLTLRFVDRQTRVLMKRLNQNEPVTVSVNNDDTVRVGGTIVGTLRGLTFTPEAGTKNLDNKGLRGLFQKALANAMTERVKTLCSAAQETFTLSQKGELLWQNAPVARLTGTRDITRPGIHLLASDFLARPHREQLVARLKVWLTRHMETVLCDLIRLRDADDLAGLASGVAFQLVENLGALERARVVDDIRALDQPARARLRQYGVRFGTCSVFMPTLLKPAPARLLLLLWALKRKKVDPFSGLPPLPRPGLTSLPTVPQAPAGFYEALGFRHCGGQAVRLDILERLADLIRPVMAGRQYGGGFVVTPEQMALAGCSGETYADVLRGLGYRTRTGGRQQKKTGAPENPPRSPSAEAGNAPDIQVHDGTVTIWYAPRKFPVARPGRSGKSRKTVQANAHPKKTRNTPSRPAHPKKTRTRQKPADPDSPFATLAILKQKQGP